MHSTSDLGWDRWNFSCTDTPRKPWNATKFDEETRILTVCEAITRPVGARVRVQGEFDGFIGLTTFWIVSTGDAGGAGVVSVELRANSERAKVSNHNRRSVRKQTPGDNVMVEGEIGENRDDNERTTRSAPQSNRCEVNYPRPLGFSLTSVFSVNLRLTPMRLSHAPSQTCNPSAFLLGFLTNNTASHLGTLKN